MRLEYPVKKEGNSLTFTLNNDSKESRKKFLKELGGPKDEDIEKSGELLHMYAGYLYTPEIKKLTKDIIIPKKSPFSSVIIENRILPHLEFTIRNAIEKLDYVWSHTLVCTEGSYSKMKSFCKKINKNIRVVAWPTDKINQNTYNNMLLSKEFWNQFTSEHILIYQQDSIIFREGIGAYLNTDYVGAPWMEGQDDNSIGVGNGGFSLRKRSAMMKCLNEVDPKNLNLGKSTLQYMKGTNLENPPEDVFFTKAMIDHKIGYVSERSTASSFSQERVPHPDPFGGHQYWLAKQSINIKSMKLT